MLKKCLIVLLLASSIRPFAFAETPVKAVLFPFRESVISARADSTLHPYNVRLGQSFRVGDVLTTLDDARYRIELKRTTEQHNFAKASFEDKKELHAKKFTSDYELKKAEFDYRMAENILADAKLNLEHCTIKAPFSGKIVEILTREFETVRPGQPLFRIIDDARLLAILNVPMSHTAMTTVGNPISIRIDDSDLCADGTIYEVTPQADHRTGTVRIRVLVENPDGKFTAGMTGELIPAPPAPPQVSSEENPVSPPPPEPEPGPRPDTESRP